MSDFFHGWRRKVGCVTLLMAAMFMVGWIRSLRGADTIAFSIGHGSLVQLISREGTAAVRRVKSELTVKEISIDRVLLMGFQPPAGNSTGNLAISVDAGSRSIEGSPYRWMIKSYGFEIGSVADRVFPLQVFMISVPYWSITIPLTLLSACLILWPGKRPERMVKAPADSPPT